MDAEGSQPCDAVTADRLAGAQQRLPQAPVAVGVAVGRMGQLDELQQTLVLDSVPGALPAGALVVCGRRHAQGPVDRLDPKRPRYRSMYALTSSGSWSSSVAKTRCGLEDLVGPVSSYFSRRSALISSRSAAVGVSGPQTLIGSSWRTYLRNVSDGIPRSLTTCAIGEPLSNTNWAPRSSSSGGYFLVSFAVGRPARPSCRARSQSARRSTTRTP